MLLFLVGGVRVVDTSLFRALWNFYVDGTVSTVLLVVADERTSSLIPGVPCRYGPAWERTPGGIVGVGARKEPAAWGGPTRGSLRREEKTSRRRSLLVRTSSPVGGGDYSCERVVGAELGPSRRRRSSRSNPEVVGDGETCRANRQVSRPSTVFSLSVIWHVAGPSSTCDGPRS